MTASTTIQLECEKDFTDITKLVQDALDTLSAGNGIVHVFSVHTTACIKILENEILSLSDISDFLDDLVPKDAVYSHDRLGLRQVPREERKNGFAHVRSLFFNHSETLPVVNGRLLLGKWQTLFLVELDPIRLRHIQITFIGN